MKVGDAARELVHSVDSVLDADPTVEANALEFAEDGIVVIETFADLAVAQAFGVASDAAFFAAEIFEGAFGKVAIAGVHGDDAMRDALEEFEGIFSGEVSVAWVVVDAEMGTVDAVDQLTEGVHFLSEFRKVPEVVLVVVFDDESDATFRSVREARVD